MNSKNDNRTNLDYLTDRMSGVFERLDKRDHTSIDVDKLEVQAIRQGRGLVALRRAMEKDVR